MKFMPARFSILIGLSTLALTGCDKFSFEERVVKTDAGEWEITLTTRVPGSDTAVTKIDKYCLTSEQVNDLIIANRYIPDEENCDSDMAKFKTDKNVTRQVWNCSHPVTGAFTATLVTGQGTNVFDKFVVLEGNNIVSLYSKQMRNAGLKKPPTTGDKIEIVELGVFKEAEALNNNCSQKKKSEIRAKNRELSVSSTGTGSRGGSSNTEVKTKLTDFLTD